MTLSRLSMTLFLLEVYLHSIRIPSPLERYGCLAYSRFMRSYARGRYEDAGIWARRLVEACCISMLGGPTAYGVLGSMFEALEYLQLIKPDDTPYDIILANGDPEVLQVSLLVGIPMDQWRLWDDFAYLHKYGNEAANASAGMLRDGSKADDWVFQSFIRILCVMLSNRKKFSMPVSKL